MKNLNAITESEARTVNGGSYYCKVCGSGRGNNTYTSWTSIAKHILTQHFGVFGKTYLQNIWKYRSVLSWAIGL